MEGITSPCIFRWSAITDVIGWSLYIWRTLNLYHEIISGPCTDMQGGNNDYHPLWVVSECKGSWHLFYLGFFLLKTASFSCNLSRKYKKTSKSVTPFVLKSIQSDANALDMDIIFLAYAIIYINFHYLLYSDWNLIITNF